MVKLFDMEVCIEKLYFINTIVNNGLKYLH